MNGHRARYNNTLVDAIKAYILDGENPEDVKNELKRYKTEFRNEPDYNWYRYGNILPYYSQIRDFYAEHKVECSDDNEIMCNNFCKHVGRAIDLILGGS